MFIIFENYYDNCNVWSNIISIANNEENIKKIIFNYFKRQDTFKDKEIFLEYDGANYYFSYFDDDGNVVSTPEYHYFTVERVDSYRNRYL